MKREILIILLSFVSVAKSFACFNYFYFVNKEGEYYSSSSFLRGFNTNFNPERNVQNLKKSIAKLSKDHDYMALSDYSISLIKLGKIKTAIDILVAIQNSHPNEYNIVANLGTAYELNGMPDSALKYIQLAVKINPASHGNSEWVHVKVLETKLKLLTDKNYLLNHTVLSLSETQMKDSMIRFQVETQIRERFPFSKKPDLIMANLMTDLGDLYSDQISVEYGKAMYQIAQYSFGDTTKLVKQKIKEANGYIKKYANKQIPEPNPRNYEAGYEKVSGFSFGRLLDDNDMQHYVVNWNDVDLNVKELLSKANISTK